MTVWIGYLQWLQDHGYLVMQEPILRSTDNIQCRDAVLDLSDPEHPKEPEWPFVEFIIGNPPFLGGNLMRGSLGNEYVEDLRKLYAGRLPGQSDQAKSGARWQDIDLLHGKPVQMPPPSAPSSRHP